MSGLVRRHELEIGLEREYALYAWSGDTLAYLLAADRLLENFHATAPGWRVAPEYSRCLVEIASPPVTRDRWPELLAGFARFEAELARAADRLAGQSRFDRIACTAKWSVRTDRFVSWDGAVVTKFADLLLDGAHDNWLLGSPTDVPACLSAPELLYAGLTSTHATVHAPSFDDADYFWRLLSAARRIELVTPQRHALLHGGRLEVAPDPDISIRDALIRWGDPQTAALLDALPEHPSFESLFGQSPSASFDAPDFHAYSCRPRVVEGTMLFELRCFHSGLPLANLAPLLDISA
jgi:hypothetical protein